jgi:putative nucleotidyltransferase with HDIG domain
MTKKTMNISRVVLQKIDKYNPKGGLAYTARFLLALCEVRHTSVKGHLERVALLAEQTAKNLKKDKKAAFFGGLFHDVTKILLPAEYFDGHNINEKEYAQIKTHAQAGFKVLRKIHLFTALCAGLHHNLYQAGYGIASDVFPEKWAPATIKKVLDISTIISICDFVDAYLNRETKIKDGSDEGAETLKEMLYKKYSNDLIMVDAVLVIVEK